MVVEALYNKDLNDSSTRHMLESITWKEDVQKDEAVRDIMALKKEISKSQSNFTELQYMHAREMLEKFHINEKEDIHKLDRRLEILQFTDADVMQTLSQLKALSMEEAHDIFPGLLKVTFYSAGHVE